MGVADVALVIQGKSTGGRTAAAHLDVVMCYVYFWPRILFCILHPSRHTNVHSPNKFASLKKGHKHAQNTPYKKGCQNSSVWTYDVPLWKYDNGRIFKITLRGVRYKKIVACGHGLMTAKSCVIPYLVPSTN